MKKTALTAALFFLSPLFLSANFAFADTLDFLFEDLRDSGENYQVDGAICEQVAKLDIQREYPQPHYKVVTGIAYSSQSHVIGELDLVVFNSHSGKAALISEVKCWKNLGGALKKVREQRRRFLSSLNSPAPLEFFSIKDHTLYDRTQFESDAQFISISQYGGRAEGFDRTLEFDLEQMNELRNRLMACQARNECRRYSERR